jgi:hypothetical protein
MPSATQCVAVAHVAAVAAYLLGSEDGSPADLAQVAEDVFGIHKLGQTLFTLYQEERNGAPSERRSKRIEQLQERVIRAAEKLHLDAEIDASGEWPILLTITDWLGEQPEYSDWAKGLDVEPLRLGGRS